MVGPDQRCRCGPASRLRRRPPHLLDSATRPQRNTSSMSTWGSMEIPTASPVRKIVRPQFSVRKLPNAPPRCRATTSCHHQFTADELPLPLAVQAARNEPPARQISSDVFDLADIEALTSDSRGFGSDDVDPARRLSSIDGLEQPYGAFPRCTRRSRTRIRRQRQWPAPPTAGSSSADSLASLGVDASASRSRFSTWAGFAVGVAIDCRDQ